MDDTAIPFAELEQRIGYTFRDPSLLIRSLTHPSYVQQHPEQKLHNQRLEFLGDAVLGLILAEKLFHSMPAKREGILTRNRSVLVKGAQLAEMAREIELQKYLRLGDAEINNGGRERESILEDAFEALIGAIYTDSDYQTARDRVLAWYGDLGERLRQLLEQHNPKGQLQEQLQPQLGNAAIRYLVSSESGPDHQKIFAVEVQVDGIPWGIGHGNSKKEAEEAAARQALLHWMEQQIEETS